MVCGDERPDDQISVSHRVLSETFAAPYVERFGEPLPVHVRYCNDRPACIAVAHEDTPWHIGVLGGHPPAASGGDWPERLTAESERPAPTPPDGPEP